MTQQTERDALRKLAEAATPGPWAFGTFHRLLVVQVDKHGYADKHSAIADIGAGSIPWDATAESMQEYNDAEYIAAANPAAVITLLDQLQSQAERIKELEKQHIERLLRIEKEVDVLVAERDELREKYTDTYWALDDAARENTSLRAQLVAIAATEPVLVVEKEPDYWNGGHFHEGSKPHIKPTKVWCLPIGTQLFTRPMPAKDAETGMINLPEPVGYIRSDQLRKVQDGWAYLCDVGPAPRIDKLPLYTETQLKQAVRDALDALKDVAQTLAWMQHGKCRGFSDGLLTTDEALDKARTALAKYKGAKQ